MTLRQNLPTSKGKNSSLQAKIYFYESSDIVEMILHVLGKMLIMIGIAMPIIIIIVLMSIELRKIDNDDIGEIDKNSD